MTAPDYSKLVDRPSIKREVQIGDCRETLIYALCEPGGVNPRYVGKTQRRTGKRHKEHISEAMNKARLPVHRWVRSLYQGDQP